MGLGATLVTDAPAVAAALAESAAGSGITASADASAGVLRVAVPPTRADVLHEVDVIEDVAIAWGYNRIARTLPKTSTAGAQLPVNKLGDHLRRELVGAGYDEALTLALVSRADNYGSMGLAEDGRAVVLANPASEEFEIVRTALVPGLLKALAANRGAAVRDGLRLFEVSDVVLLDGAADVGARNERRLAALYTGPTAGFDVVHGLADRVMRLLEVPHRPFAWCAPPAPGEAAPPAYGRGGWRYHVEEDKGGDPAGPGASYFPGRGAALVLEREGGERRVGGTLGVLHPRVLAACELVFPVSVLEMCIEPFVEAN